MIHSVRAWNRKNIKNYVEIYIKSDLKKLLKRARKEFTTKILIILLE
jgi:adenylylsulfate kinase-like enzyme